MKYFFWGVLWQSDAGRHVLVVSRRRWYTLPCALPAKKKKDILTTEAAWIAMMLLMGQESDSDRMNVLRLILRDAYVTTTLGQKLIDQLSNMGVYPRDVVEM